MSDSPSHRHTAVIFDLGNVVLDWNVDRILGSLDLAPPKLDLLRAELFAHQDWYDLDHGIKTEATVTSEICKRSALTRVVVEDALLAAKKSLSTIPESILLMQEIKSYGLEMFCLSNMSRETYGHIKNQEFFELFSGIVISGIERCMKPQAEIFQLILQRYEIEPANALFIDDSLPNILKARELGLNSYHFKGSEACYAEIRELLF